jgi:hypothetical protein
LTHRVTHDNKFARDVLAKLLSIFEVLDTAGMDCRKAIPSPISDYEDAVMIETALRSETDCIVTRIIRDYSKAEIPCIYTFGVHSKAAGQHGGVNGR